MSADAVSDGEAKTSSKLNKVVERLKDVSREPSPEPLSPASSVKDDNKAGGSSRRKPKVTHKVVDTDDDGVSGDEGSSRRKPKVTHKVVDTDDDGASADDEDIDEEPPFKTYKDANGVNGDSKDEEKEKKTDDAIEVDEEGNPILPEGTVMVEPEAVDEKRPRFQGPEFDRRTRKRHTSSELEIVHCTACWKQINTNVGGSVLRHPRLKVLLCKRCYEWYCSDIITKDDDGDDEQCTWCGDGGELFVCDCHSAFCRKCVQRNMGRGELKKIEEDDNWKCYNCESEPLEKLRKDCDRIIEKVEEAAKKRQEEKERKERNKKEQLQKREEKAKAKAASGKSSTPKKSPAAPVAQQIVNQLLAGNKNQVLMQARGQPGNMVLVPKGTKPGSTISTPKGKVILDMATGLNKSQVAQSQFAKLEYLVTTENVEPTLEKILASTDSMAMLLKTLKEELRPAKTPGLDVSKAKAIKFEVAKKVRRALDAQVRTLNELHFFTKRTAASQRQQTSLLKSNAAAAPPRVQDIPELAGLNIGQIVTPNGLSSAVGKNVIIAKETLSSNIQLVTLNDGRVLAVQTVPVGAKRPGALTPKKAPSNADEVIELDSSDDDSPKKDSPPAKKYKPGPKCSKVNRPGPKCSKIGAQSDLSDSDSKKDKFKMRISLGAKSFPGATRSKETEKSDSEASNSSDDKPLKPKSIVQDSKSSDKENEESDEEKKPKSKSSDESKESDKSSKKDKDDDSGDAKGSGSSDNNNKDSNDRESGGNNNNTDKDGDTESGKKSHGPDGNTEDDQMDVDDEECVVLQSQLDGTDADTLEILNSESTRDSKDGDDSPVEDGNSGDDETNDAEDKNKRARENLLADDSDSEVDSDRGRQTLLDDNSSDEENQNKSAKKTQSRKHKAKEAPPVSEKSDKEDRPPKKNKGRKELLVDDSSDGNDIVEKSRKKLRRSAKKGSNASDQDKNEINASDSLKGRDELLADDSSDGEKESSPKSDKGRNRGRDALLADDSDNESKSAKARKELLEEDTDENDKENKRTQKKKKGKDTVSKVGESEDGEVDFVVLGEYNAETKEIEKLDDDILVQLDGAGKGLNVIRENGKQQSEDEATAESMEESDHSDSQDNQGKPEKRKGKSSTKFPSKNGKKSGACNDVDSSDGEQEKNTRRKRKTTKKIKHNSSDEGSDFNLAESSDEDLKTVSSPTNRPRRKTKSQKDRQLTLESIRNKRAQAKEKENGHENGEKTKKDDNGSSSEDDVSSAEGEDANEDMDVEEIDEEKMKEIEQKKKKAKEIEEKLENEEKHRKALLDSDSEASDNVSVSDDSDMEVKVEKKKKVAQKGKKAIIKKLVIELSDCEADSSKKKKKRSSKQKKIVLDISSLSDSSADEKKKKKKKKGKKKAELDSDVLSEDSDFMPAKKKQKKRKRDTSSSDDDDSDSEDDKKKSKKGKGKKKRRRIKKMTSSSNDGSNAEGGEDDELGSPDGSKRKKIRKLLKDKKLKKETKSAAKEEEDRRKRIKERQKLFNEEVEIDEKTQLKTTTKCVLETSEGDDKEVLIEVSPGLIRKLKPHQVEAVKFLWDSCCESVKRMKKEAGAGCILAHCMGLGKTLSMITFVHTLMRNHEKTGVNTCLVVSPLNTVLNWQKEWVMWSENVPDDEIYDVYELASAKSGWARTDILEEWHENGGLLIIGYEMYRNLTLHKFIKSKKMKKIIDEKLVDPGPDVVVCDEGHILKNSESAISKALSKIKTRRRVVLTGTPLQNNLVEYHCMVDFVKPSLLGTLKEFRNRFANPITNGQCADSTAYDVKLMKRRAHILHETLDGCVQRRDYSALAKFLPPKHEYVVSIRMTKVQIELYRKYLERSSQGLDGGDVVGKGARLFSDYQSLMKIWTHPWVLKLAEVRDENKKMFDEESMDSFLDDDDEASEMSFKSTDDDDDDDGDVVAAGSSSRGSRNTQRATRSTRNSARRKSPSGSDSDSDSDGSTRKQLKKEMRNSDSDNEVMKQWKTRSRGGDESGTHGRDRNDFPPEEEPDNKISDQWWAEFVSEDDQYKVELGGKLNLLSEILKMCESIGDKVLIFSQSLLSLNLIEDFLSHWNDIIRFKAAEANDGEVPVGTIGWIPGIDYFRMDGSTSAQNRKRYSESFNEEENIRARLFLISTKAGSLGTNMVGANRVIIFDASWNPSHDVQSIFRVYRFGQTKPCYIYRFLAQGTMEEKIYGRQVSKQSLSARVVDEHQIDRHFTYADLKELYDFQPAEGEAEEVPALPKDRLLAELLQSKKDVIYKFHEHDSLLENKVGEELTEEERKAAWDEYENEKKGMINTAAARYAGNMGVQGQQGFGTMVYQMRQQAMMQQMGIPTAAAPIMGAMGAPQMGFGMNIESVCKSIMTANPGITQEDLQRRIESYLTIQYSGNELMAMAQQQQQLQQRQVLEHQRLQMMEQRNQQLRQQLLATANTGGVLANQLLQPGARPIPTGVVQNTSAASSRESAGSQSAAATLQNLLKK